MSINLQKGQTINLDKNQYDLSIVTIGLGWDVKKTEPSGGLLSKMFRPKEDEEDYDLDAMAFLLDRDGKIANLGDSNLGGSDIIFFNNQQHPDGTIYSTGDNRTGEGEGDDEQIVVKLDSMNARYHKILFIVSIYKGIENKQHFGKIDNSFIRAVDAKGKEIAKYNLSSDPAYNNMCSMIFAEVYRKDEGWKFRAIGEPKSTDSFMQIIRDSNYIREE